MRVEDGKGRGFWASINAANQLETHAVAEPHDRYVNRQNQRVWSLPFTAIDPVGANDYFLYIKNTGTEILAVTDLRIESTVAGIIEVQHVSGTPVYTADTDITPVNRYLGSSNVPVATAKTDTDTTGLTSQGVIFYMNMPVVDTIHHLSTSSNIIIPPGQQMALLWTAATGILSGVVSLAHIGTDV